MGIGLSYLADDIRVRGAGITSPSSPVLYSFDFTANSALPPELSVSRPGNATLHDGSGIIRTVGQNLFLPSISLTGWNPSGSASLVADTDLDPDGNMNAATFTASAGGSNAVYHINDCSNAGWYVFSAWAKRHSSMSTDQTFYLQMNFASSTFPSPDFTATSSWQRFSLRAYLSPVEVAGQALVPVIFNGTDLSACMINVAKLEIEFVTSDTQGRTYYATTTDKVFQGERFDHVYNGTVWVPSGLRIEEQQTQRFEQTHDLSLDTWGTFNGVISTGGATGPDGNISNLLVEDTTNNFHGTAQSAGVSGPGYASIYAKETSGSKRYLVMAAGQGAASAVFDIADGTVKRQDTGTQAWTVQHTNGWWRCFVTTDGVISSLNYGVYSLATNSTFSTGDPYGRQTYTGDGASGMYLYGPQAIGSANLFSSSFIQNGLRQQQMTRLADVLTSNSPLTGYLSGGPSVWELTDLVSGATTRASFAAGAFTFPVNKLYRSFGVYPSGTDTTPYLTVGGPY